MLGKSPTLAEILRAARERQGLTYSQIEIETNIRPQYIEALENEDYAELPADIYLVQILQSYASYLGLDGELIYKIFLKERRRFSRAQKPLINNNLITGKQKKNFIEPIAASFLALSPRTIVFASTLGIVLLVSSYVFSLYFSYVASPTLEIIEPHDNVVVEGASVLVSGLADPGDLVTINGSTLPTDEKGYFSVNYDLQNEGENIISVVSTSNKNPDRYTSLKKKVIANLPAGSTDSYEGKLVLELELLADSWLAVTADQDKQLFEGVLKTGDSKIFHAKDNFTLIVGNAGGVVASLNGRDQGVLGESGEVKKLLLGKNNQRGDMLLSYNG